MGDDVADLALDAFRRDAVELDIFELLFAPAIGLGQRALDRSRPGIGIEDHAPVDIAGGAADRLDQRGLRAEEAFLVRVEDRDQPRIREYRGLRAAG